MQGGTMAVARLQRQTTLPLVCTAVEGEPPCLREFLELAACVQPGRNCDVPFRRLVDCLRRHGLCTPGDRS